MSSAEKQVTLKNRYGLHARPATMLAEVANRFAADILVIKDGQEVNGKSIFSIMMLGAEKGSSLTIRASGKDADDAVRELQALIDSKFHEE